MEAVDETLRLMREQPCALLVDHPRTAWSNVMQLKEDSDRMVVVVSCQRALVDELKFEVKRLPLGDASKLSTSSAAFPTNKFCNCGAADKRSAAQPSSGIRLSMDLSSSRSGHYHVHHYVFTWRGEEAGMGGGVTE